MQGAPERVREAIMGTTHDLAHAVDRKESPPARMHARGAAEWLRLAAMPTFALMALLVGGRERSAQDLLCPAMSSPWGGMAIMYLLMAAFHLPPWLKLLAGARCVRRR